MFRKIPAHLSNEEFLDELGSPRLEAWSAKLATYLFDQFANVPYKCTKSQDCVELENGKVIQRRNHGLLHFLRVGFLTLDILDMLKEFRRTSNVECELLRVLPVMETKIKKFNKKMFIAACFQRTGRESEVSGEETPFLYDWQTMQDANNFYSYVFNVAKEESGNPFYNVSREETEMFASGIDTSFKRFILADTDFVYSKIIHSIIFGAHCLDLFRISNEFDRYSPPNKYSGCITCFVLSILFPDIPLISKPTSSYSTWKLKPAFELEFEPMMHLMRQRAYKYYFIPAERALDPINALGQLSELFELKCTFIILPIGTKLYKGYGSFGIPKPTNKLTYRESPLFYTLDASIARLYGSELVVENELIMPVYLFNMTNDNLYCLFKWVKKFLGSTYVNHFRNLFSKGFFSKDILHYTDTTFNVEDTGYFIHMLCSIGYDGWNIDSNELIDARYVIGHMEPADLELLLETRNREILDVAPHKKKDSSYKYKHPEILICIPDKHLGPAKLVFDASTK